MQLKKLVIMTAVASSLTLGAVGAAFADTPTPTPSARATETLSDAKSKVDHRITIRLDALTKQISRLKSDSHLNVSDETLLLNDDQGAFNGLTALKAKVDADATAADVKTDEQQIVTYKVFEILIPRTRQLIAVDDLQATSTKLGTLVTDVQNKVNTLQGQGVNVSSVQSLLTDASTKLQTINGELANDQSSLVAITATSTTASTTFQSVRTDLSTVRSEFSAIRSDFKQIKTALAALHPTVTPTATP